MSRLIAALMLATAGCAAGSGTGPSAPPAGGAAARSSDAGGGAAAGTTNAAPGAGKSDPRATPAPASSSGFRPPFAMKELSEKDWLRAMREKLAGRLNVPAEDLFFSPARLSVGVLRRLDRPVSARRRGPPPRRRYRIEVVDHEGQQKAAFTPISARGSDEPPKDLRFLAEDRLVYEVVSPPPPPPPPPRKARGSKRANRRDRARNRTAERAATVAAKPAGPAAADTPVPPRLFVIQPVRRRARPIRCEGTGFAFVKTPQEERMAFVTGRTEAAFVSVNGAQVYPRRGRAVIASEPAWSKDGIALAFLERPAGAPARLILLAEFDNPSGDTIWPLPPTATVAGARVFWAGPGKLVVGRSALKPIFATSFVRERPREFSP